MAYQKLKKKKVNIQNHSSLQPFVYQGKTLAAPDIYKDRQAKKTSPPQKKKTTHKKQHGISYVL